MLTLFYLFSGSCPLWGTACAQPISAVSGGFGCGTSPRPRLVFHPCTTPSHCLTNHQHPTGMGMVGVILYRYQVCYLPDRAAGFPRGVCGAEFRTGCC